MAAPRPGRFQSGAVPRQETGSGGVTLVELLVVLSIIAVLAGLLLPALMKARAQGQGVACLNHHRQLSLACLLYAGDAGDAFPYNLGEDETRRHVEDGTFRNWATNVMNWELDPDNTNIHWLKTGSLGPYVSGGIRVFRCPADRVLSDLQRGAGWSARVRSLSMNAMVGNAGRFSDGSTNVNVPGYRQFYRLSDVPEPARIFVFIEEHPDSVDDGYFLNSPRSLEWHDLPATYHRAVGNLSFADGHVERHAWRSSTTRQPARPEAADLPLPVPAEDAADFEWLMDRTSVRRYQRVATE